MSDIATGYLVVEGYDGPIRIPVEWERSVREDGTAEWRNREEIKIPPGVKRLDWVRVEGGPIIREGEKFYPGTPLFWRET